MGRDLISHSLLLRSRLPRTMDLHRIPYAPPRGSGFYFGGERWPLPDPENTVASAGRLSPYWEQIVTACGFMPVEEVYLGSQHEPFTEHQASALTDELLRLPGAMAGAVLMVHAFNEPMSWYEPGRRDPRRVLSRDLRSQEQTRIEQMRSRLARVVLHPLPCPNCDRPVDPTDSHASYIVSSAEYRAIRDVWIHDHVMLDILLAMEDVNVSIE